LSLKNEWERVVKLGWLAHFKEAAEEYNFPTELLIAVGSRETNLDPKYLKVAGDHGNGYGLMQVDKRYFPEWVKSGNWRDARDGILKGASVLSQKRKQILESRGRTLTVNFSTGGSRQFVMPEFEGEELKKVFVASYNSGMAAPYHVSRGRDCDYGTTGQNYSKDVLERAQFFKSKLSGSAYGKLANSFVAETSVVEPDAPQAETATTEVSPPTPIPNLKTVLVEFGKFLFKGYVRASTWATGLGIGINTGILEKYPFIILFVLLATLAGFAVYYKKKRKAAGLEGLDSA
jgi:hypothetical protein